MQVNLINKKEAITLQIIGRPNNPKAPPDARWVWNVTLDPIQYDIQHISFMGAHDTATGLVCYDPELETAYSEYKEFGPVRLPTKVKVTSYLNQNNAGTGKLVRYALFENTFNLKQAILGGKISEDQFIFSYAKGMTVVDQPAGKVYAVGDNLDDLSKDLEKYNK